MEVFSRRMTSFVGARRPQTRLQNPLGRLYGYSVEEVLRHRLRVGLRNSAMISS